jgi:hypothetical protein
MYTLSEKDVNRLIILCAEKCVSNKDSDSKQQYQHLLNKLKIYKDQNHAPDTSNERRSSGDD